MPEIQSTEGANKFWNSIKLMIPLFFCNGSKRPAAPYLCLTPTNIRWNDFGRNYHADLEVKLDDNTTFQCRALVMPLDWTDIEKELRFDDWVNQLIPKGQQFALAPEETQEEGRPCFISLLDGETSYRQLSISLAQTIRMQILASIHDLSFLIGDRRLTDDDNRAILSSENFALGFMRRGSAYQALHRGHRHIWGAGKPLLADARHQFEFSCEMRGFKGDPHTLSVEFVDTKLLEDRIHCLVGKNGCGKTRMLRELILGLAKLTEPDNQCFFDNYASTAEEISYTGPMFRRVLCFALDSNAKFPSGTKNDARFEYIYTNLSERDDVRKEALTTSIQNQTRLLVDILRSDAPIDENSETNFSSRKKILKDTLRPYIDLEQLYLPLLKGAPHFDIDHDDGLWISAKRILRLNEKSALTAFSYIDFDRETQFFNEQDETFDLSSGHRVFFRFVVSFLSYIDLGTIVIIDEPETHLHPNLVCDFMNLVYDVLSATKSIALIATHSAYVIREVPTHCAHVYSIDEDGSPSENSVYLHTLGANIENISQAVFSDSNAEKYHKRILREMVDRGEDFDTIMKSYAGLMSADLLSQVSRMMKSKS